MTRRAPRDRRPTRAAWSVSALMMALGGSSIGLLSRIGTGQPEDWRVWLGIVIWVVLLLISRAPAAALPAQIRWSMLAALTLGAGIGLSTTYSRDHWPQLVTMTLGLPGLVALIMVVLLSVVQAMINATNDGPDGGPDDGAYHIFVLLLHATAAVILPIVIWFNLTTLTTIVWNAVNRTLLGGVSGAWAGLIIGIGTWWLKRVPRNRASSNTSH